MRGQKADIIIFTLLTPILKNDRKANPVCRTFRCRHENKLMRMLQVPDFAKT